MKHSLVFFLLLTCWTVSVGSKADETAVSPELSPQKSGAATSSTASLSVVAGPLKTERVALLTKIQDATKKGIGIRDYMAAFQNLEGMVKGGESPDSIRQRLGSIDHALTDQLAHLEQSTDTGIPPETGIVGFKFLVRKEQFPEIATVFPGTAAAKAQLAKRDLILEVNGVPTKDLTKDEIYEMLVGTPGTSVRVKILRGNVAFVRTLKRTRLQDLGKMHPDVLQLYTTPAMRPIGD